MIRTARILVIAAGLALTHAAMAQSKALEPVTFKIEPQPLADALTAFSKQAALHVIQRDEEVSTDGLVAPRVEGKYAPEKALKLLLESTDLTYEFINDRAVRLSKVESADQNNSPSSSKEESAVRSDDKSPSTERVDEGHADKDKTSRNDEKLEEIVVSAQKRGDERLQDVPIPITTISGESLALSNQFRLAEYAQRVPGLTLNQGRQDFLAIRGVTTGSFTNPKVGVLVDDVPFGAALQLGGGTFFPDPDPSELTRVEVLRGPQGTLYGASSLGGLLKYVMAEPSTVGVSGRLQTGVSTVHKGGERGYNVRASINVPLRDTMAIRISGFTRAEPGYIDNQARNTDDANEQSVQGGRLAMLWQPSERFSAKFSALFEDFQSFGSDWIPAQSSFEDLQQSFILGSASGTHKRAQAYNLTLSGKVGAVDLTSVTGYNEFDYRATQDESANALWSGLALSAFNLAGVVTEQPNSTEKFTQELRLSIPLGQRLTWLFGGFFNHDTSDNAIYEWAADTGTGQRGGEIFGIVYPTTYREFASFTNLTVDFTDRFSLQLGARKSYIKESAEQTITGDPYLQLIYGSTQPQVAPKIRVSNDAFTYLVTPQFKLSADVMAYARIATGYSPPGPNVVPGVPRQSDPDYTRNYEIGLKGDFLEHRLSLDVSVYHIAYKDIQIQIRDPISALFYVGNGGRAKSQGVELSITARPIAALTISGWVARNTAELTEAFPPGSSYGVSGDRLPFSSPWSGNVSVNYDFPLWSGATGYAGGAVSYVDERVGLFTATAARDIFPSYVKTDIQAGVKLDSWTANVFVNNLSDKRGVLFRDVGIGYKLINPRTIGVNLSKTF